MQMVMGTPQLVVSRRVLKLSFFEDSKLRFHGGFVTSKLETIFPLEKIPVSIFDPRSNETTFYEANTLPSALARLGLANSF